VKVPLYLKTLDFFVEEAMMDDDINQAFDFQFTSDGFFIEFNNII